MAGLLVGAGFGWLGAGLSVFGGVAKILGVVAAAGVVWGAVFAAGVFGVGEGFGVVAVFAGTGTSMTPLSGGMNWLLGLFGSIV